MSAKPPEDRQARIDELMAAALHEELRREHQHLEPEQYEQLVGDAQLLMLTTIMREELKAEEAGAPPPTPEQVVASALQELKGTRGR